MYSLFFSLEPEWAAAATEVKEQTKGKVKLAAVDATVNQMLAGRYGVNVSAVVTISFPSLACQISL